MKFFETDWNAIVRWLALWDRLTPAARRHYLLTAPAHAASVRAEGYGTELPLLLESGLVESTPTGRLRPTRASVPFRSLMAQLAKYPLFDEPPTAEELDAYLSKHYLQDELDPLRSWSHEPAWDTADWPRSFLEHRDPRAWEQPNLGYLERRGCGHDAFGWPRRKPIPPKQTWFPDKPTTEAARHLVRQALDALKPVPLLELRARLPEALRPGFDPALKACLRFLLLYPALRSDTLEPVIGLCPTVLHFANRPAPVAPVPEPCPGAVGPPFRVEDMGRLLAETVGGECRVHRQTPGGALYKVIVDRLAGELVPLPPWVETRAHGGWNRLHAAKDLLVRLKWAAERQAGSRRLLVPTELGRGWLRLPPVERVRDFLKRVTAAPPRACPWEDDELCLVSPDVTFAVEDDGDFNHEPWLKRVWAAAPDRDCVRLEAFLDHAARVMNPLVDPAIPDLFRPHIILRRGNQRTFLRAETVEAPCRELLERFFWGRLVPWGCVETVVGEDEAVRFRLSSVGCFFVGRTRDFTYGQPAGEASILVQPNFEIVFLQPDLGAEMDFSAFAERRGRHVGTLFHLTRARIIAAAAHGLTADAVLATLERHSSKAVPENVAVEIRAWFGACRTLPVRRSYLIQAGDPETVARLTRVFDEKCRVLTDNLVELQATSLDPARVKKLNEAGVFFEFRAHVDARVRSPKLSHRAAQLADGIDPEDDSL